MRIFILDKEKITKFNLPSKVSGVFAIDYLPVDSRVKRTVSVEAENDNWILKSNGSINVINGNAIMEKVPLVEYRCLQLQVKGRNDFVIIYALPSFEQHPVRYLVTGDKMTIGTDSGCSIVYRDQLVLPAHLAIWQENKIWYVQAANDDNHFSYLNDKRITKHQLHVGDVIFVYGLKIIWMGTFVQLNKPVSQLVINNDALASFTEQNPLDNTNVPAVSDEEMAIELYNEHDYFFHTPRLTQSLVNEQVTIDAPPGNVEQEELPFILTLGSSITLLSTSALTGYTTFSAVATGSKTWAESIPSIITCVTMIIGTIIMPKVTNAYQKRRQKQKEQKRQTKYSAYVKEKEQEINAKLLNQAQILRNQYISIPDCYNLVFSNRITSLWNHEIRDEDFMSVKLGTGNCPAKIEIKAPEEHFVLDEDNLVRLAIDVTSKLHTLENVPIVFSFAQKHISAFICNSSYNKDFMNGVFLQLLALHSSQDLKLVFLLSGNSEDYRFAKFAPHCLSDDKSVRFFADSVEEGKYISAYLEDEFSKRKALMYNTSGAEKAEVQEGRKIEKEASYKNFNQFYLIVTNDYTAVKNIPIVKDIVETPDNLGFALTIIDSSLQSLPNECKAFVEVLDKESCIIEKDLNNQYRFVAEVVPGMNMRAVANRLANIPVAYLDVASSLPTSLTFLEMYNAARIEQLNILNKWKENDPTVSLKTPIGVHTSGDLFELDLHEKYHGPHGLIAGSTGSGKSEFIITYILSMCVNYHPDEVQFVLIDYKGGGLAGAFENRETGVRVPHLVGTITNLDTSEMNRTLVSINSELKRRQKMFNDAKGNTGESTIDIYKYQHYYRAGVLKEPISHLFIISDEFAELKSQQPDFMNELISTARIGRSLGVHLILATQKPSGVVNDQIWSNTKFRVCLKVQDRSDSMEVLKKPDAAGIKETGRFYLQVGYDEYFDIGQSGWAGARYIPSDAVIKKIDDSIKFIDDVGKVTRTVEETVKKVDDGSNRGDQLTNIVKYLTAIAKDENYVPKKLWLDKIPEFIYLGNLIEKYGYKPTPYQVETIIGEYDNPAEQMQGLFKLDITNNNTLVYGMADSGKENLLNTYIYSIITNHTPDEVNLYIIDYGAETLKIFSKTPHVGAVCTIDDNEKLMNMLTLVDDELDKRKELFVDYAGSYNYYCQNSGSKLPLINIVINGYEVFSESVGRLTEALNTMYRDSLKYGITFTIIAGAAASFRGRAAEYFSNKLCLQMANDGDYRTLLNSAKGLIPAKYSGRGISGVDDLKYEFQTAYITEQNKVNELIKETNNKLNEIYQTGAPKVKVMPKVVTVESVLSELNGFSSVPVGIDLNTKEFCKFNFEETKVLPILYSQFSDSNDFIYSLLNLLSNVPNTKSIVLDADNVFDANMVPSQCHFDGFEAVIPAIIQEIQSNTQGTNFIIQINGISKIRDKLGDATEQYITALSKCIIDSPNSHLIISDNYSTYKLLQVETWYSDIVDHKQGIWVGPGIDMQILFNTGNLSAEIKNSSAPDIAYVITKTNAIVIKRITAIKEEENNEK